MVTLSKRLEQIARLVPQGSRLADIGSDHALLPVYLAERGLVSFAAAGEVNPGPYDAARKQVAGAGLSGKIDVRLGDGLGIIGPGEIDTVTIAGMGGGLIVRILSDGRDQLDGVQTLILQPNVGEELVRRHLLAEGWFLQGEAILEEDGKIYEVLHAVRTADAAAKNEGLYSPRQVCQMQADRGQLLAMGPYLLAEGSETFIRKWNSELRKLVLIMNELDQSELDSARAKREEMGKTVEAIREVLLCLQKDKP